MHKTWCYEDGLLEVRGEEIAKRPSSTNTQKQLYFKIGYDNDTEEKQIGCGDDESVSLYCFIVTCTVRKSKVSQQYLVSLHDTHVVTWFFSHRLLTLPSPSLERFRQEIICDILLHLPELDGLSVEWGRQMALYALCRDRYHIGPVHDPSLFPEHIPSSAMLVAVILHHFACHDATHDNHSEDHNHCDHVVLHTSNENASTSESGSENKSVEGDKSNELTESKIKQMYTLSAERLVQEYKDHCLRKQAVISYLLESYRSGFPLPSVVLKYVQETCIDFDWTSMPFQMLFVQTIIHDEITVKYPPPLEKASLFFKTFTDAIESNNQEVHEELLKKRLFCTEALLRSSHTPSVLPSGYTTLTYGSSQRVITLLMNTGINNNDGLTAWKAGYLMAEFILDRPDIFKGKRCLELGSGTGITAIILARHAKPASLLCTDYDYVILDNLAKNLEINHIAVAHNSDSTSGSSIDSSDSSSINSGGGSDSKSSSSDSMKDCPVLVRRLDWSAPDLALIERFDPEIIFTCDTVYLPEMLGPLTSIFQFCLRTRSPEPSPAPSTLGFFSNLAHCFSIPVSLPLGVRQSTSESKSPTSLSELSLVGDNDISSTYPMVLSMQTKRNEQTFSSYLKNVITKDLILRNIQISHVPQLFSYPRTPETCELHKITAESII